MSSPRINRYLAQCGFGSRRAVEELVRAGAVTIDGEVVTDLSRRVEEGRKVEVRGKAAAPPEGKVYAMLNKPAGYLCSRSDPAGRPIIYDLLSKDLDHLHYIGRLDFQSRGLLLLTTDGELTHRLLHPSYEVPRTYRVWTRRELAAEEIQGLLRGVEIEPGQTARPTSLRRVRDHYEIVLKEGKKREIRRMLEVFQHKVVDLQRIRFGGLGLGDLPEGEFRRLKPSEIALLHGKAQP
jgi:23S rRNA pseudouridine2605 synthase